jgi:hypothetical protein
MPALPLVSSGVETLLGYVALVVVLAAFAGAAIGLFADRPEPAHPKKAPEATDLRKAA